MTDAEFDFLCKNAFNSGLAHLWTGERQELLLRRMQGLPDEPRLKRPFSTPEDRAAKEYTILKNITYVAQTSMELELITGLAVNYIQLRLKHLTKDRAVIKLYEKRGHDFLWVRGVRWQEKILELSLKL